MNDLAELKTQIKQLIIDNLMLQRTAESLADEQALFGPGSLGLDSVDALQLVVALEKSYGLKVADSGAAQKLLRSVSTIAEAVTNHQRNGGP